MRLDCRGTHRVAVNGDIRRALMGWELEQFLPASPEVGKTVGASVWRSFLLGSGAFLSSRLRPLSLARELGVAFIP